MPDYKFTDQELEDAINCSYIKDYSCEELKAALRELLEYRKNTAFWKSIIDEYKQKGYIKDAG